MTDAGDLVARLRNTPNWQREHFGPWKSATSAYDRAPFEAADKLEEQAAAIAALRTDLAYYQAKWEHELSTVSKLERERDALRREVDGLKQVVAASGDLAALIPLMQWALEKAERAVAAERELAALKRGEFICQRCGIRKDGEHDTPYEF